jgi:alpha-L-rhamnosidase
MGILDQRTGATSLYETWDVTRRIGDASLNHPSMGAVSAWMYKYPAGIRLSPDAPAFKKILIQPCFLSDLDFVEASHESMYGTIRVDWRREEGRSGYIWFCLQRLWLLLFCPGKSRKL